MSKVFVVIFTLCAFLVNGQDTAHFQNKPLSFGVAPIFTTPVLLNFQDPQNLEDSRFEGNMGAGLGIWAAYRFNKIWTYSKLSFKAVNYTSESVFKVKNGNLDFFAGAKFPSKRLPGLNVILGYNPSYAAYSNLVYQGDPDSFPTVNLAKDYSNRLAHNLQFGLEFDFKEKNSLEVGLVYNINRLYQNKAIDGVPHQFSISYNFNFSKNADLPEDVIKMKNTLYQLQQDTLYVVNRGCESDFTTKQLDSLFQKNYKFSAFRILEAEEISAVVKQPNVIHFAIIGVHYASENDPESSGIYLCDKNMVLTDYPYPYHTFNPAYGNGMSICLGELKSSAGHIRYFSKRLKEKLDSSKKQN